MERGSNGERPAAGLPKVSRYEDATALVCSGVFLVAAAAFSAFTNPDRGSVLSRRGLPMWAFAGLLALVGVGTTVGGLVALVVRRLRRR